MENNIIEITLTIIAMSFWILFPIGMFISVSHVDKNTDQVVQLGHLRHDSIDEFNDSIFVKRKPVRNRTQKHWDYVANFQRFIHH